MLLEALAAVDVKDNSGATALMHASVQGHDGAMRVLLEAGAAVDLIDNDTQTALIIASMGGHTRAVRLLLEAGSAVNAKDNNGMNALTAAIGTDNLDVTRLLGGRRTTATRIIPLWLRCSGCWPCTGAGARL